ncbi:MAG: 2-oxoacid:acceptor oxidoreductase subunit alpha [Gemmatimonadota bacterium]|nr:MAG: 2-oxoacid:acceptor oxidoreductase subunit alpha [Gemmatimonadota bacterium]
MEKQEYDAIRKLLGESPAFIQGDVACAYGAVLAGCRFFAGYPITPATETAESMAALMPRIGGTYIQMEDEIASIAALIGASWAGEKTMTTTSGPGFSLMQENIGYACMTETPCVIVDVQRSGPSTGQPTEPAQGDMMQARWGSHGDYEIIALVPNSVQECLDLVIEAFNLAERFRVPVIVLTDGEVGHMREKTVIPEFEDVEHVERTRPTGPKESYVPFGGGAAAVPPMGSFGLGYRTYVTGLTHTEKGLPATSSAEEHTKLVSRLCEKIRQASDSLVRLEERYLDDAEFAVVSYGITSRVALSAVRLLRRRKRKVGYLRLIGLWPFPEEQLFRLGKQVKGILVPEMNLGQMYHPIREAVRGKCRVAHLPKIGGEIHTPAEIVEAVERLMAGGRR